MSITSDNKKLYITSSQGIAWHEIAKCLGTTCQDEGTLCGDKKLDGTSGLAGRINPWAKYKPIRNSSKGWVDRDSSVATIITDYGFGNPPESNRVSGLVSLYNDKEQGNYVLLHGERANSWRYLVPRGGSYNEYYRSWDFLKIIEGVPIRTSTYQENGYDSTAKSPFGDFVLGNASIPRKSGVIQAGARYRTVEEGTAVSGAWITLTDINSLTTLARKMLYYGLVLVPANETGEPISGTAHIIYNQHRVDYVDSGETFYRGHETLWTAYKLGASGSVLVENNYLVFPFLTNDYPTSGVAPSEDIDTYHSVRIESSYNPSSPSAQLDRYMYSIPCITPLLLNVFNANVEITIDCTEIRDITQFTEVGFAIRNNYTNDYITIKWCEMFLCKQNTTIGSNTTYANRQSGETFYMKQSTTDTSLARFDDSNPSGTYSSPTYNTELNTNSRIRDVQVSANGGTCVPYSLDSQTHLQSLPVTLTDENVNYIHIRCWYTVGTSVNLASTTSKVMVSVHGGITPPTPV